MEAIVKNSYYFNLIPHFWCVSLYVGIQMQKSWKKPFINIKVHA